MQQIMNSNNINTDDHVAEVGAGISLIELYTVLGAKELGVGYGLGFQGGSCPSVGFTGLVSGGGMGLQSSRYGWAADRITAAEVVVFNKDTKSYETVEYLYCILSSDFPSKAFRSRNVVFVVQALPLGFC